jgi:hypothetical protein
MPISTPGMGTPIRPRNPPNAITTGKVRQHPDRRRAELSPPEPHRDHRDDVIEAGERMHEAGDKPGRLADLRMRECRGRQRGEGQRETETVQPWLHCRPLTLPKPS